MESYVQLRFLCGQCGEYQEFCYPEAEPEAGTCPKCGRKTTTQLARCTGKVTWFVPYVTKPRKNGRHSSRMGLQRSGRNRPGTGRPKKKPLCNEPYKYIPQEDV